MGDAERLAREAFEEVAGDGFLGREADRMDESVEGRPGLAELGEEAVDLAVVGHVAIEHEAWNRTRPRSRKPCSLKRSPW